MKLIDHLRNALAKRGRGESYELSGSARSGADTARLTISPLFILAGTVHLARPDVFASIMPEAVPHPHAVIIGTGIAEVVGAAGLFVPRVQALAGVMLALYAICVYPANIAHAVHDLSTGTGLGWAYHYPRLFVQPLICWWALAAGGLAHRSGSAGD